MLPIPQWVLDLQQEITEDDYQLPGKEAGGNEVILGPIPEELQKLFMAQTVLGRKMKELLCEAMGHGHMAVCQFTSELEHLNNRFNAIGELFWSNMQVFFDCYDINVAIRNGWQAVKWSDEEVQSEEFPLDMSLRDFLDIGSMVFIESTMPFGTRTDDPDVCKGSTMPFGTRTDDPDVCKGSTMPFGTRTDGRSS